MALTQLTDEELFSAVKRDDRKAFDMLYERYWALVYKKAFFYLHDQDACLEIVNDIFLNIWLKRGVSNILIFKNYLASAARFRVYNVLKARKNNNLVYVNSYEMFENNNVERNAGETDMINTEIHSRINGLLNGLPERCKEIFLLSKFGQLSNSEIAVKLSISKRTVENQISLSVKYLKNHYAIQGKRVIK
ncbi:sigma-70 family RNA polymerase sigma factor [Pedobacter steynii]|uniref:RNA polymerase sigma factor 70 region 4 type 2 domain-containing protein n=1 Tax=Pedobacter steynii TaxID=430522 RepID=A0A1D7QJP1_9SPHI|nr:sigma-70 family RNA polymerase sigma factor [Pedobacter steynii]AOM78897.1 hypothetical protein BFS30_17995 [Pedobacter steynii]